MAIEDKHRATTGAMISKMDKTDRGGNIRHAIVALPMGTDLEIDQPVRAVLITQRMALRAIKAISALPLARSMLIDRIDPTEIAALVRPRTEMGIDLSIGGIRARMNHALRTARMSREAASSDATRTIMIVQSTTTVMVVLSAAPANLSAIITGTLATTTGAQHVQHKALTGIGVHPVT